jgi:hypothetical protein
MGAAQGVVSPRGDDGYPVPCRLCAGLGMREVARFVPPAIDVRQHGPAAASAT